MTLGDRIRAAREHAKLTQPALAKPFNLTRNAVSLWESGKNVPTADKIGAIARITGVNVQWLWAGVGKMLTEQLIPDEAVLIGYIGAGQRVFPPDEGVVMEGGLVPPPGYTKALAARIRGQSMKPLEHGWLVFYEAETPNDAKIHINKLCAVGLEDGSRYIKKLMWKNNRFVLRSWNPDTADIVDAKVVWASPIIEIRPR